MDKGNERLRDEIIETVRSMHKHGLMTATKLREYEVICEVVPTYTAEDVKNLRSRLNVSQAALAKVMNASPSAVRAWESGQKRPGGTACKLLSVLDRKGLEALV